MRKQQTHSIIRSTQSILDQQYQKAHLASSRSFPAISSRYHQMLKSHAETKQSKNMIHNYLSKQQASKLIDNQTSITKVKKKKKIQQRQFKCGACKITFISYDSLESHVINNQKCRYDKLRHEATVDKVESIKLQPKIVNVQEKHLRQHYYYKMPKQLTNLFSQADLSFINKFDSLKSIPSQQMDSSLSLKYFIEQIKQIAPYKNAKISILSISQVIAVYLDNLKQHINGQYFKKIQIFFYQLILFINWSYYQILKENHFIKSCIYIQSIYQSSYCQTQRPEFLTIFIQQYLKSKAHWTDLQVQLLKSLQKWVRNGQLGQIELLNSKKN